MKSLVLLSVLTLSATSVQAGGVFSSLSEYWYGPSTPMPAPEFNEYDKSITLTHPGQLAAAQSLNDKELERYMASGILVLDRLDGAEIDFASLPSALSKLNKITKLVFDGCTFEGATEGLTSFFKRDSQITHLEFANTTLTPQLVESIQKILRQNNRIVKLEFVGCPDLNDQVSKKIFDTAENENTSVLDLVLGCKGAHSRLNGKDKFRAVTPKKGKVLGTKVL